MKFCQECGTRLNDTAKFCTKCGMQCETSDIEVETQNIEQTDFSKYYGLSFKDIFGKTIELTQQGVYIYRHKGVFLKFDNTIPYKSIININLSKPSLMYGCGYLSVVTANGGLSPDFATKAPMSSKASKALAENPNVIGFRKMSDIQAIYDALTIIMNG